MDGKVICVGMQKTGTTSMHRALNILGYKVKGNTSRLTIPILKGNFDKAVKMIRNYDAVEDTPWFMIYRELDERIPGCKFIHTVRDEERWFRSVSRHMGDLKRARTEWIYGRGKGIPKDNKENTIRVYREHNQGVMDYFKSRPDDLLVLNFEDGDGWEKLCGFLGKAIPDQPFPHANKGNYNQDRSKLAIKIKTTRQRIKNNFKIWHIDTMGYWEKPK
jgi:hypothetical protein